MNIVLCLNAVCIVLEDIWDDPTFWGIVESVFAVIYVFEVVCKSMIANSFAFFWLEAGHKFDFVMTVVSVVGSVAWILLPGVGPGTMRYLVLGRVLRLLALIAKTEKFAFIFQCITKMTKCT